MIRELIDRLRDAISAESEKATHPNEWSLLNDMQADVTELSENYRRLGEICRQNKDMKG